MHILKDLRKPSKCPSPSLSAPWVLRGLRNKSAGLHCWQILGVWGSAWERVRRPPLSWPHALQAARSQRGQERSELHLLIVTLPQLTSQMNAHSSHCFRRRGSRDRKGWAPYHCWLNSGPHRRKCQQWRKGDLPSISSYISENGTSVSWRHSRRNAQRGRNTEKECLFLKSQRLKYGCDWCYVVWEEKNFPVWGIIVRKKMQVN